MYDVLVLRKVSIHMLNQYGQTPARHAYQCMGSRYHAVIVEDCASRTYPKLDRFTGSQSIARYSCSKPRAKYGGTRSEDKLRRNTTT
jgi:hypothetical protein